jgi:Ni/Co efflux regulator RcnB
MLSSNHAFADANGWSNYQGTSTKRPNYRPYPPQPPYPPQDHRPPNWNRPQANVSINLQAPAYTQYNHQSTSYVFGDANSRIESSNYRIINDWQRLGLPEPPQNMYWIFENGRYVLVPR